MLKDVLAGVIAGLVMATAFLGAVIFFVATRRDTYDRVAARLPPGLSPTVFLLAVLLAIPPLWGLVGAVGGALFHLADSSRPGAGLASSNFLFTLAVICLAALAALALLVVRRRLDGLGLALAVAFAGIFGWLLPFIASWR